jgi:hypothetical protein
LSEKGGKSLVTQRVTKVGTLCSYEVTGPNCKAGSVELPSKMTSNPNLAYRRAPKCLEYSEIRFTITNS